jgi:hypothetical protein
MDQSKVQLQLTRLLTNSVFVILLWSCGCGATGNSHAAPPPAQHSVSLSWNVSSTSGVQYNIYRGTQHTGPYPTKLNSSTQATTTFTDSTVQSGTTYYYVVTAVDSNQQESDYSNEALATIPAR